MTRQPSLFNFKPTEVLRHSGLTPDEGRLLIGFCLSDDYPREHTVERTGTRYRLKSAEGARRLLSSLRYGTATVREHITVDAQQLLYR